MGKDYVRNGYVIILRGVKNMHKRVEGVLLMVHAFCVKLMAVRNGRRNVEYAARTVPLLELKNYVNPNHVHI